MRVTSSEVGILAAFIAGFVGVLGARTQRVIARESRRWERRADAYRELLHVAWRVGYSVQQALPLLPEAGLSGVPPALPSAGDQALADSLVEAFGSEAVRKAHVVWRTAVRDAIRMVNEAANATGKEAASLTQELHEVGKPAELKARQALSHEVAKDLGSRSTRHDVPAGPRTARPQDRDGGDTARGA
jgi:hypothetical protein